MSKKQTLTATLAGLGMALPGFLSAQTARVQVIHNSADAAAEVVDVYINGNLAIDDFTFRTATSFLDLPSGVDLEVGIAPGNSTGAGDIIPGLTATYNLAQDETYVLVANGIVSPTGYSPATPFEIYVSGGALETSPAGTTSVLVFHGSTDAPTVQVAEMAVLSGQVLVSDLSYGDFAGYLEVPTLDFVLQVQLPDGTPVVSYGAPLETLGLDGAALVVAASGFLDPSANSNGPAFGLWVALPTGGDMIPLPVVQLPTGTARVQVIHNSADAAAAIVDVYINGDMAIDDFAFRTATPFLDLPSGIDLEVGIAPGNSTGAGDIIPGLTATYNLEDGETYVLVANGIVSPTGYTPATPFEIYPSGGALESSPAGTTSVLVFHGSTDAPTVQVAETAVLAGQVLVSDLSYGDFAGYLEVPTLDFVLQVQLPDGTPVVSYSAPLQTLGLDGAALVVAASGFLDPSVNSNGPAFGLWVALPTGGDMIPLPLFTSISENNVISELVAYPNPANDVLTVDLTVDRATEASVLLMDQTGRVVRELLGSSLTGGHSRLLLPVADVANGSYVLSIVSGEGTRSLPVQILR